ncbi:DNA repair protein RecO [Mycoplasmopsis verecunda]|uniref:DNA replication and repair protein RecO n=1 Tax=Mycoplasmopsis verecunda TaxID=171291 RepID=A0A1T4KYS3_9BACT|nr:DNA repair protein RecO [Mycoplasmopsis verecunda]WPB54353.1 DNA repair protein RecO [Mycoplasmopsis verecunda]SJZ47498.1 DNA replication and repair protein RecO [Mycoplasmopsis verecunda]
MVSIERAVVLDIKEYEDNKFLVTFFSQRGAFSLYAQGLDKPYSKNRNNLIIGSIVELEYFRARFDTKVGKLKKASVAKLFDTTNVGNNLFFNKLKTVFQNIKIPNHLFTEYDRYFYEIGKHNNDYILTYFVAQLLVVLGYCNYFNKCRVCGSTRNFASFDIQYGGFICIKHDGIETDIDIPTLQCIWSSFHSFNSYMYQANNVINKFILNNYVKFLYTQGIYIEK